MISVVGFNSFVVPLHEIECVLEGVPLPPWPSGVEELEVVDQRLSGLIIR